jgi:hypothetical protein
MAITNASRLADFGSGIGTQGAVLQVDNTNNRLGVGTTNPQGMLQVGTGITMYSTGIGSFNSDVYVGGNLNVTGDLVYDEATAVNLNISGITTVGSGVTIAVSGVHASSGIVTAASFEGDGSALTGVANTGYINATQLKVIGVTTSGSFEGDGAKLTGLPAGFTELDAALFN